MTNLGRCVKRYIKMIMQLEQNRIHLAGYHYSDVIMSTIASQITSLAIVFSTVYPGADQRKHKAPRRWPLWGELTGDRWIPRSKGQQRGKWFHLMTSSWYCTHFSSQTTFSCQLLNYWKKVLVYLESTMKTLVFDILIFWKWLVTNHKEYCYFNTTLTCKKWNVQCPILKIHNRMHRNVTFFYTEPNISHNFQCINHCILNLWKFCVYSIIRKCDRSLDNNLSAKKGAEMRGSISSILTFWYPEENLLHFYKSYWFKVQGQVSFNKQ